MDEPTKKDGIWIKTNRKYNKVMINQQYANYQSGVWSSQQMEYTGSDTMYTGVLSAIFFHGKIHCIARPKFHYIYNPIANTITFLGNLPRDTISKMVIYADCLYLLCSGYTDGDASAYGQHLLKYNESSDIFTYIETPVSTLSLDNGTVYDDSIIYWNGTSESFYKYDGNTFTRMYKPFNNIKTQNPQAGGFISYNGQLHIFGNGNTNTSPDGCSHNTHYGLTPNTYGSFNATSYNKLPVEMKGCAAVLYNNNIHIIGGNNKNHYMWNNGNDTYTLISNVSYTNFLGTYIRNGNIEIMADNMLYPGKHHMIINEKFQSPEKVYNPNTLIINRGSAQNGTYLTNISDTSVIEGDGSNNRFVSGFDDCFYFADSAFDWNASMYYGNGSQWIKFKN